MQHVRLAIVSLILLLWAAPVYAGTVAIVQRSNPTPALIEALTRIHGELLSVGLEVRMIARPQERSPGAADSRAWLETIAAEGHIDAVIEVVGDLAPAAADVWVIEKAPRRLTVSRISLEPSTRNAPETLAIRAVEVLRSTFLERDMIAKEQQSSTRITTGKSDTSATATASTSTSTTKPTSTAASRTTMSAPTTTSTLPARNERQHPAVDAERFGVAVGAAVLTSLDGVGPAILPTARFDWRARHWFEVQAAFAGFGTKPTVSSADGRASIAQQYGVFGGCFGLRADTQLWPFLALSAGAMHTAIEGQAELPRHGHDVAQWSLLFDVGLGVRLRLTNTYYVSLAGHAQMTEPYMAVHIMDSVVANSGRPNLALTLTIGAWL